MPTLLPIPRAALAAMASDGRRVAYVPVSGEWQHWKHYRGGQADDIWVTDTQAKTFKQVTTDPAVDTTPTWAGEDIYFISERGGLANLFRLKPGTGAVHQITHYTDAEARYPSSDGKSVVFQHGDALAEYDIATDTVKELNLHLDTDRVHSREKRVPAGNSLNAATVGPTGKRVVIESRGQLVSLPVDEGDSRLLAPLQGSRSQFPSWSYDGKKIAFVSDRSGEDEVWVTPADGTGKARQLTKDHKGPLGEIRWSPDGKYVVTFDREARIMLVNTKTGETTLVDQADRQLQCGVQPGREIPCLPSHRAELAQRRVYLRHRQEDESGRYNARDQLVQPGVGPRRQIPVLPAGPGVQPNGKRTHAFLRV
jgi:tricorn protease